MPQDIARRRGIGGTARGSIALALGILILGPGAAAEAQPVRGSASQSREPEPKGLWAAAAGGNTQKARSLIESGAAVDRRDERGWTPLIYACRAGHAETAKLLLRRGAEVNRLSRVGSAPIAFAAGEGHPGTVRLLLDHGADPNKARNDAPNNVPALIIASSRGHTESVRLLLAAGAKVDAEAANTRTALYNACLGGHAGVVELLLEHGADPKRTVEIPQKDGHSATLFPIVPAAAKGHEKVVDLLLHYDGALERLGRRELKVFDGDEENGFPPTWLESEWRIRAEALRDAIGYTAHHADTNPGNEARVRILKRLLRLQDRKQARAVDGAAVQSSKLARAAARGELETIEPMLQSDRETPMEALALALRVAEQEGRINVMRRLRPIAERRARELIALENKKGDLIGAAANGDYMLVAHLLDQGLDPNWIQSKWTQYRGSNALHRAAMNGHTRIVRLLLNHGAEVNKLSGNKRTAADFAAGKHPETLSVLLQAGGEVNQENIDEALNTAAFNGQAENARGLLEAGADPNADTSGLDALPQAAKRGHAELVRLLLEHGAEPGSAGPNPNAATTEALPLAAWHGHLEIVELMLEHGVEVNDAPDGSTALMVAQQQRRDQIVAALEAAGARERQQPVHLPSPFALPLKRGDTEQIKELLEHGAEPNGSVGAVIGPPRSPLDDAIHRGMDEAALAMLEAGAELTEGAAEHAPDGEALNHTPSTLLSAVGTSYTPPERVKLIKALLDHGAEVNTKTGFHHRTPIMAAAREGNASALRVLLEAAPQAPDLGLKDKHGQTAMQLAIDHGHDQAATVLRRAGATR